MLEQPGALARRLRGAPPRSPPTRAPTPPQGLEKPLVEDPGARRSGRRSTAGGQSRTTGSATAAAGRSDDRGADRHRRHDGERCAQVENARPGGRSRRPAPPRCDPSGGTGTRRARRRRGCVATDSTTAAVAMPAPRRMLQPPPREQGRRDGSPDGVQLDRDRERERRPAAGGERLREREHRTPPTSSTLASASKARRHRRPGRRDRERAGGDRLQRAAERRQASSCSARNSEKPTIRRGPRWRPVVAPVYVEEPKPTRRLRGRRRADRDCRCSSAHRRRYLLVVVRLRPDRQQQTGRSPGRGPGAPRSSTARATGAGLQRRLLRFSPDERAADTSQSSAEARRGLRGCVEIEQFAPQRIGYRLGWPFGMSCQIPSYLLTRSARRSRQSTTQLSTPNSQSSEADSRPAEAEVRVEEVEALVKEGHPASADRSSTAEVFEKDQARLDKPLM